MKRFKLTRLVEQSFEIEIEAKNEKEAKQKGYELGLESWTEDVFTNDEIIDVEEIK